MDYYMSAPDAEAAQYQYYQYAQHFHPGPPGVYDPTSVEHNTNFEGGHPSTNNVDANSPPAVPNETREEDVHHHLAAAQGLKPERRMKMDTVYKKAPGAPKRFKSSYVHFFTHFVEKKKQQLGPDGLPIKLDISSVSKECSQAWKDLPSEQRKYWDYVSEQEKQEYMKQKDAYEGPWRIATNKLKKKKDGAPKRSPSAFFLYVNSKRPQIKEKYPDMANTELVKTCSEMWKEASDSEKAPFLEEEKELRAKYHVDADKYKKKVQEEKANKKDQKKEENENAEASFGIMPPERHPPHNGHNLYMNPPGYAAPLKAATTSSGGRSKKRKRDPNAPKRSPPAFFLFVNHCRPELKLQYPELRHTELVKMLGQKWSQMSEEEKRPFRDHEEQLRQQYHIDIKHYKKAAVPEQDYTNLGSFHVPMIKHPQVVLDNASSSIPPSQQVFHRRHHHHQDLNHSQQPMAQPNYHHHNQQEEELDDHQQTVNYFE